MEASFSFIMPAIVLVSFACLKSRALGLRHRRTLFGGWGAADGMGGCSSWIIGEKTMYLSEEILRRRKVALLADDRAPGPSSKVAQYSPANMHDQNIWSYTMISAMSSRKVTIHCLSPNKNVLSKVNI